MKFIERENEIINILKKLSDFKMVVVGGYAVSARAKHRFSVDCDIVVPKNDLNKIIGLLSKEGFEKSLAKNLDNEYSGEFIRYVKKVNDLPVSVDIVVNSLACRTTNASWGFDYILKNSDKAIIAGVEDSVECMVPNKELLLAFKIHSARKTDLRDIIMLKDADWSIARNHLNRGDVDILKKEIKTMIKELDDKNLVDSLKGVFQLKEDIEKIIQGTKNKLSVLLKEI